MKNFYYENMAIKTAGIVLLLNAAAIIFISALDTGFNTLGNIIFVIETILGIGILAFLCSIFYFIFPNFPVGVFKFVY